MSRHKKAHPCSGIAGRDFLSELESRYTYSGPAQNVASKDGHRTYLRVIKFKQIPSEHWIRVLTYQVGRDGFEHELDLEFSGTRKLLLARLLFAQPFR